MADKAENEDQSGPAGSERRAALRSGQPGGVFTRVRESGFPMRKASTLPDVSAYTTGTGTETEDRTETGTGTEDETGTGTGTGAETVDGTESGTDTETKADTGTEPETEASTGPEASIAPTPVGGNADSPAVPEPENALTGQEDAITMGPNYRRAVYSPPDHVTTDPASPATQQIAAVPLGSIVAGPSVNQSSPAKADDAAAPDTSSLAIRPPEEDVARRANERDEAAAAKPLLPRILQVVVAVFFPVILLAAAVRAVTTPLFLWVEYHRPGFPADSYGFSTEDRMTYGSYAMDYILNWAPARYLGDLVDTDGDRLFLDSEAGHMADVKGVLSTGFVVATVLAILAVAACVYLARRYPGGIRRSLFAGAVATLVLAIALAVAGVLAWETFFTQVHALFFADGTWTFRLDDTLIRLFPAQFWIDAAATVGAIVLIGAALTLVLTWPTRARREKSARAYSQRRRANSGV